MKKEIKKHLDNLVRLDAIRLSKLLEISQYTILAFILGFISGSILNDYLPDVNIDKNTDQSDLELILDILLNTFLIAISVYYSHKLLNLVKVAVPFYFSLSKKYISCKKNECTVGIALGFSLSFMGSMTKYKNKIKKLHDRLFREANL